MCKTGWKYVLLIRDFIRDYRYFVPYNTNSRCDDIMKNGWKMIQNKLFAIAFELLSFLLIHSVLKPTCVVVT